MLWSICFFITAAVILECTVTALVARFKGKGKKRSVKLLHVLFAVCFLSAVLLCIPPYHEIHGAEGIGIVQTAVFSVQKAIRVFGADEMCDIVLDNIGKAPVWLSGIYSTAALAIQFVAPLLTFSFLISFFKNLLSYRRYLAAFWKDAHIFSEMNVKSVALARSIAEQDRRERKGRCGSGVMLAFTDVLEENEESYFDLLEEAKELGAVIFRKDLDAIHFAPRLWRRKLHFYLINDDAAEKIRHAASIAENYDTEDAEMYVFSDNLSCGLLLSAMDNRHIRVYRVNDIQALIYHNLSLYGARLFQNARIHNGSVISAVIVGLGRYGTEMLKALLWYGQMTGFMMKIHVFDEDKNAESLFTAQCPEVMQMNKKPVDGESPFDVTFHSGIDAGSAEFTRLLGEIPDATYVFVSLGGDEKNVAASIRIRTLYERVNPRFKPDIETIVYDSHLSRSMGVTWHKYLSEDPADTEPDGIRNFKNKAYRIHMIGDLESFYSVDTVIDSALVQAGLEVNRRWANCSDPADVAKNEKEFWRHDYNYRSSIAKALHEQLRRELTELGYISIPGVHKPWHERSDEEKLAIGRVEHIRWNAYMRTEGYRFGAVRNDMAKQHHNLVSVYELTDDDLRKDA